MYLNAKENAGKTLRDYEKPAQLNGLVIDTNLYKEADNVIGGDIHGAGKGNETINVGLDKSTNSYEDSDGSELGEDTWSYVGRGFSATNTSTEADFFELPSVEKRLDSTTRKRKLEYENGEQIPKRRRCCLVQ